MEIRIENNKLRVTDMTLSNEKKIRNKFRIRAPGAFFSEAFRSRQWDGYVKYITDAGYMFTGLFPKLIDFLEKEEVEYIINDIRPSFGYLGFPDKINGIDARELQSDAVKSVLENYVEGIYFPRGILDEATNAGKTNIAILLHSSFSEDKKTCLIINRIGIYNQLINEIGNILGKENVGYIGSNGVKWKRFMICMAPTLARNINKYKSFLEQIDIAIVDECHYAASPTYQSILSKMYNALVRVGMSGSPLKHKDKNKNEKIISYFGNVLHTTRNSELIALGFSTPPTITLCEGNTLINIPKNYKEEETLGLIKSSERNNKVIKRVRYHANKKRLPILVIAKFHNHTELLYKKIVKKFPDLKVDFIHVKIKDRMSRLQRFKEGKIDILVSSLLIKEGQNLPLIKAIVVAAGGDSIINVLQILGRGLRTHKSKKRWYLDDFMDEGAYLKRHSKHRKKVYKDEGFKIIDKLK